MRNALAIVLVVVAAGGCKKDEPKDEPAGKPTGGTSTVKPVPGAGTAATPRPSQGALPQLPAQTLPPDAKRAEKVALGHALWFDPRMSVDGSMACYSCHQNEHGNGGKDPLAIGPGGKVLPRHAPVVWNASFFKGAFYWDGRAPTLEAQAKGAWAGGNMGVGEDKLEAKAAEIAKVPGYATMFKAAFGDGAATADQVTQAIAEYERTLLCIDTRYDKYAAGDKTALNEAEQRGLDVFLGKGQCSVCHTPPFFSAAMNLEGGIYFNVGVGTAGKPEAEVDPGRMKVTSKPEDWAAFKPPSLRNITKSAPYFHDGSAATLVDAVRLMATGGIANKNLTPLMADRKLTDAEQGDLITFLGALECGTIEAPAKLP